MSEFNDMKNEQSAGDASDAATSISEQYQPMQSEKRRSLGAGTFAQKSTDSSAPFHLHGIGDVAEQSDEKGGPDSPGENVTQEGHDQRGDVNLSDDNVNDGNERGWLKSVDTNVHSTRTDELFNTADFNDEHSKENLQEATSGATSSPSFSKDGIASRSFNNRGNLDELLRHAVTPLERADSNTAASAASNFSLNAISSGDIEQTKNDIEDDNNDKATTSFSKAGTLRSQRQNKLGKFPSTNWKRIRNTLKAASEMQGPKKPKHPLDREDSFLKKFSTRNHQDSKNTSPSNVDEFQDAVDSSNVFVSRFVIQHDGTFMFYWLGVMTLAVLYNIWTCIARQAFREIQDRCNSCWYSLDAIFDFLYVCDILVQFRTGYLDQGLMVYDARKLCSRYAHSRDIYIDIVCLLPLDLIQFLIGIQPMIRFPRFFKVYRSFRFLYMLESRTNYPNLFRVANLTHLVLLGSHWFAAFYYMISEAENFQSEWSYPPPVGEFADITRKYLRSLYWATMTLTTIGDLPHPTSTNNLPPRPRMTNAAYVFVIGSYLIGVFVFATIVGQVGNVINNRNASRIEFERLLDGAKVYMQTHNVPHNLQKRVQRWYDYVWSRGRLNGCDINSLGLLPDKLKTELAIHVNLETLKKVTIFHECQPEFLHDLVLKMKAYIFTPGDLICRKGEVAREMFIIADGVVEIISETGVMIKRMGAGDFFGEIGILNLDGGINRRSADVRSVGYLELFVLSREDVLEALKDHPEAESVIRDYGHRRLRVIEAHRQKVKHFKTEGIREESENHTDAAQSAQNKFLQTLKNWNSVVRRQSSQVANSLVSSSASGSTPDLKRFVPHRNLTTNKVPFSTIKSSANTPSGLSFVSVEKPDFSTGFMANRFSETSSGKRKRLSYLRLAYTQIRNVFNRKKGKRWNVGVSDSPKRKFTEQRLLLKPADDQAVTLDLSACSTSFRTGCHVTVNIEDCSANSQIKEQSKTSDDERKETKIKASLDNTAKAGPGVSERKGTGGQSLGRLISRNVSDSVSYTPVETEDIDEKYKTHDNQQGRNIERQQAQIILDVVKINDVWKEKSEKNRSESLVTFKQPPILSAVKQLSTKNRTNETTEPSIKNAATERKTQSQFVALKDYPILAKSRTKNDTELGLCTSNADGVSSNTVASKRLSLSQSVFDNHSPSSPSSDESKKHSQGLPPCNPSSFALHFISKKIPQPSPDRSSTSASMNSHSSTEIKPPESSNDVPYREPTSPKGQVVSSCQTMQEYKLQRERNKKFGTSCDPDELYVLNEFSGQTSPHSVSRQRQDDSSTVRRQESSINGRSQPLSIIQQLTSDMPYQNLASEINNLQGILDKRLTLLEEAFMSTSAQIDRLAASQDVLVQLMMKQMTPSPTSPHSLPDGRQSSQYFSENESRL